jgi:hypothetical protein
LDGLGCTAPTSTFIANLSERVQVRHFRRQLPAPSIGDAVGVLGCSPRIRSTSNNRNWTSPRFSELHFPHQALHAFTANVNALGTQLQMHPRASIGPHASADEPPRSSPSAPGLGALAATSDGPATHRIHLGRPAATGTACRPDRWSGSRSRIRRVLRARNGLLGEPGRGF